MIPHLDDPRIEEAIASVRRFDDCGAVRLIVVDGCSRSDLVARIREALGPCDQLVSEPDRGIFDALNKGLELVETPYLGWIGADDLFSGQVLASEVLARLQAADLFVGTLGFLRGRRVERVTVSWPSARGLVRVGLHNGHFSTFGRSALLKAERFDLDDPAADLPYFLSIFARRPRVAVTRVVTTWQRLGGASNRSIPVVLRSNRHTFMAYRRRSGLPAACLAISLKLGSKVVSRAGHLLRPRWAEL